MLCASSKPETESAEAVSPKLPEALGRAVAQLLGRQYECPVPLPAYCPPWNAGQLGRLAAKGQLSTAHFNGRSLVDPATFFLELVPAGLIGAGPSPADRQTLVARTCLAEAERLDFWREDLVLARHAILDDAPLPVEFLFLYAGRSKFFEYFAQGLARRRNGRWAAAVPSEFTAFVRQSQIPSMPRPAAGVSSACNGQTHCAAG